MTREEIEKARKEKEKITVSCKVSYNENETVKAYCEKSGITKNQFCYIAICEKLERDGFLQGGNDGK